MALGICMSCQRLVSIRPGSQKWGSREVDWYPVEHSTPMTHAGCGGVVTADEVAAEDSCTLTFEFTCEHCGVLDYEAVVQSARCDGYKKPIR